MRSASTLTLLALALVANLPDTRRAPVPILRPNPNTAAAGVRRGNVLTIDLVAEESFWRLNGAERPPMTIPAFAETGKPPVMPGPLVRALLGTELRFVVHNDLGVPLTFFLPALLRGGPTGRRARDSVFVAPGDAGTLTVRASVSGNYVYRAILPKSGASQGIGVSGALAGAIVIDTLAAAPPAHDRVFVIMATMDSLLEAEAKEHVVNLNAPEVGRLIFTINGRSWPNTERITATVGDSLHWRIINASADFHPMHLHGFYYRVAVFSNPAADSADTRDLDGPGHSVVTQLLPPLAGMSMTWSPTRAGNWIFHCHFALHLMPDSISAAPDDPHHRGMVGLVMLTSVSDRPGVRVAALPTPVRRLRLIAIADSADTSAHESRTTRSMRFVLEAAGRRIAARPGFSPELDLTRGEPVSIMVVNHLDEPTSVHWHGIEVENSYVDGVPGVSGAGRHLAPAIAPGDSFEARFTPPRSGTFMYHAHVDENHQQQSGLLGPLIVRDSGIAPSTEECVFFLKGRRLATGRSIGDALQPLEINGQTNPDTIVLHVGRPVRVRLLDLVEANPSPTVLLTARPDSAAGLTADSAIVQWRRIAKDGADLPPADRVQRPARQIISMGETYDFEFLPERAGQLRLEVRLEARFGGQLLARVPMRVE